ncbi:MAG TPA: triphosphoribosyl-dephospho-CoA synthase [Candidatus Syntrophoarchaeum butanivorans]|uniref:Triphosphoribosyl-dephospho-CoA synthase n=1 Tax=Candidatus Syntropharchaeum butanivorans TaxID=1839936 RepID=A0A1F2P369_9EURY|nr:MAG: triphosphoribosyl-dephospho-CoA synthase [Candidatus Syntrophoarchaeum butanivorans]HEC57717.1 triphosphoribosyl-dephospho-CoA synthase [Candidatus Syntrophoarchaeum butanivorans]
MRERRDPDRLAQAGQLAMLLEVSASPKPGNVDRCHDYPDTRYEDFLASSVAVYPVLMRAASSRARIGRLIFEAVSASKTWHKGGNTHFGAFTLLIPLIIGGGEQKAAHDAVKSTGWEDAIEFYRAAQIAGVRVKPVEDLDLTDPESFDRIKRERLSLYEIFSISASYDLISNEWVNGFPRSFRYAEILRDDVRRLGLNDGIVMTFLRILSESPDTFVAMKFGADVAREVSERARVLTRDFDLDKIKSFDEELIERRINPGSSADIIIASLFIALVRGWI